MASVGGDASAASTQLLDKLNARVDAVPASVAAALTTLARERGGGSSNRWKGNGRVCVCKTQHALTQPSTFGTGVALACRYCRHLLTAGNSNTDGGPRVRRLQRFLPLPSEALDDVADFMLCFR